MDSLKNYVSESDISDFSADDSDNDYEPDNNEETDSSGKLIVFLWR